MVEGNEYEAAPQVRAQHHSTYVRHSLTAQDQKIYEPMQDMQTPESSQQLSSLQDVATNDQGPELPPCVILSNVTGYAAFLNGTYHRLVNCSFDKR